MEKGGKSKRGPRKPRAQDANGNDAAAAGKPTAEATAPEGKRGRAPEKPRAARNPRGPTVEVHINPPHARLLLQQRNNLHP